MFPEVQLVQFHKLGIFNYSASLLSEDKDTLYMGTWEAMFASNAHISKKEHEVCPGLVHGDGVECLAQSGKGMAKQEKEPTITEKKEDQRSPDGTGGAQSEMGTFTTEDLDMEKEAAFPSINSTLRASPLEALPISSGSIFQPMQALQTSASDSMA
ncbi:hypothetical protein CB1_001157002 [Camelus ferus]|nr:hypothetical protein CB1_001157002 [Camelus ferus]